MEKSKKIEVDISGNMESLYKDSVVAFATKDGSISNTVFLSSKLKRKLFNKYKDKIKDLKEQMHCIMIYFCIKDHIEQILEMKICPDISPFKIVYYLDRLFKNNSSYKQIKKRIKSVKHNSTVHKIAYRTYKKRQKPNLILDRDMVVKMIKESKG